ncbi:MAG TPA: AMP-binding protein [Alphaproteobacteria bacterium]|nr:AMP-binding protein [Alphaproteobacteria bacterium]
MTGDDEGFIHLFAAKAEGTPARNFARFNGAPISFAALGRGAQSFARGLRDLGVARGDRVAVMLRNSPETLAVLFGLARAAAVWVPVNVQLRGEGLRYILEHAEPRLVIADAELAATVRGCGAALRDLPLLTFGEPEAPLRLEALLERGAGFAEPLPRADDPFAIMYTSGTTGKPKGVIVTHRMLRLAGEAAALVSAAKTGDVLLMWEPLYHIGGAQLLVLPLIREVILAMIDRFSASRFWQQAREYGATHIHYLGGILQILLKQPPSLLDRGHGVRIAWGGGCPKDVWRPFMERFGVEIRECYGMTEACSITTYNDAGVVGAVGRPVPWFTVELLRADGRPASAGARGEIVVRASRPGALFPGYFRNPEASAAALKEGALYTGDLGSFDPEGNLVFHGRLGDNVRTKGENVTAWEVEHVAAAHPAVEDCAMIGVTAQVGEEDIKLFLKLKPGASIDFAELSAWLGERLAPYQNPRYLALVDDFERTPSQRIMKHRLPRDTHGCWDRLAEKN